MNPGKRGICWDWPLSPGSTHLRPRTNRKGGTRNHQIDVDAKRGLGRADINVMSLPTVDRLPARRLPTQAGPSMYQNDVFANMRLGLHSRCAKQGLTDENFLTSARVKTSSAAWPIQFQKIGSPMKGPTLGISGVTQHSSNSSPYRCWKSSLPIPNSFPYRCWKSSLLQFLPV